MQSLREVKKQLSRPRVHVSNLKPIRQRSNIVCLPTNLRCYSTVHFTINNPR